MNSSLRSLCWLMAFLSAVPASHSAEEKPNGYSPESLLQVLARVSNLYHDSALSFACNESIVDSGLGDHTYRFEYIYIYDESKGFQDYRTQGWAGHGEGRPLPVNLRGIISESATSQHPAR